MMSPLEEEEEEQGEEKYNKRRKRRQSRGLHYYFCGESSTLQRQWSQNKSTIVTVGLALFLACCVFWTGHRRSSDVEALYRIARARELLRLRNGPRGNSGSTSGAHNQKHLKLKKNIKTNMMMKLGGKISAHLQQHSNLARYSHEEQREKAQDLEALSDAELLNLFESARPKDLSRRLQPAQKAFLYPILHEWANRLDQALRSNKAGGLRWIRPYLLPPIDYDTDGNANTNPNDEEENDDNEGRELVATPDYDSEEEPSVFFKVKRKVGGNRFSPNDEEEEDDEEEDDEEEEEDEWVWKQEWKELQKKRRDDEMGPPIDYTQSQWYEYPPLLASPPAKGGYPEITTLGQLLQNWPQTQDIPTSGNHKIREVLLHFNYSDPNEREMAERFRDARLPFKVYDIPDLDAVTNLWTDDYVHQEFDASIKQGAFDFHGLSRHKTGDGMCQESPNHFFAFFVPPLWQTTTMGLPPVRNNDWTFRDWSNHARYADAKPLQADQPHFYWQAGVPKNERFLPTNQQSFISRDLQTTLSSAKENFFIFDMKQQKGIQCRFGERSVTAATHYDSGQNMIAMITGAKRYILSPPKACSELGVFSARESPIFRHSLLNFDHLAYWQEEEKEGESATDWLGQTMSEQERAWLRRASQAPALETVLKAGEVLFLPSFWFHYIVSLQKSAQCNVRSGVDTIGTPEFGNQHDIDQCGGEGEGDDENDDEEEEEEADDKDRHPPRLPRGRRDDEPGPERPRRRMARGGGGGGGDERRRNRRPRRRQRGQEQQREQPPFPF